MIKPDSMEQFFLSNNLDLSCNKKNLIGLNQIVLAPTVAHLATNIDPTGKLAGPTSFRKFPYHPSSMGLITNCYLMIALKEISM